MVLVACAPASAPPRAQPAAPARTEVPVVALPADADASAAPGGASYEQRLAAAEAAVPKLVAELEDVERTCRDRWPTSEEACARAATWTAIAHDYQAFYAEHDDAARDKGRIDALPRLGGRNRTESEVVSYIVFACSERCDRARREGRGEAIGESAKKCSNGDRNACPALEGRPGSGNARSVCESHCDDMKAAARVEREREARRPRTKAQAVACLQTCMRACTGGRIVVRADGTYTRDPDDWCGTCDFTCASDCAIRP